MSTDESRPVDDAAEASDSESARERELERQAMQRAAAERAARHRTPSDGDEDGAGDELEDALAAPDAVIDTAPDMLLGDGSEPTPPLLEIVRLGKLYGKKFQALSEFSLTLQRGDVFGLIGPNGAGKTTTFRILATLMKPTVGRVRLCGLDYSKPNHLNDIRRKIGYMPDTFGLYDDMTVREYLNFFAAAYDIPPYRRPDLVRDVLDLVDLGIKSEETIVNLSRGMQQRLGLARVLIHDPDLLILDEPASGLDPRARVEIRSLLVELQKMGKTIIISSHILADLGEICNRIGIIERGKLLHEGAIDAVLAHSRPEPIVRIRITEDPSLAVTCLQRLPMVREITVERGTLVVHVLPDFSEYWLLTTALAEAGLHLVLLQPESRNLEHAFMTLTKGLVS